MHNLSYVGVRRGAASLAAALVLMLQPASAPATVRVSLSFFSATNLMNGQIGALGTGDDGTGQQQASAVQACCFAVAAAPMIGPPATLTRNFGSLDTISQLYYFGVASYSTLAPPTSVSVADPAVVATLNHLVMALNTGFSATLVGQEFSAIFPTFTETQIISDLYAQTDVSLTQQQRAAATDRLTLFQSELFRRNAGFGVNDAFTLTSFSTGVVAGTGFSRLAATAAVPEPATWATMILGFGLAGGAVRRGRRQPANA